MNHEKRISEINEILSLCHKLRQIVGPAVTVYPPHAENQPHQLFQLGDQQHQSDILHAQHTDTEEGTRQTDQPFQTGIEELDHLRVAARAQDAENHEIVQTHGCLNREDADDHDGQCFDGGILKGKQRNHRSGEKDQEGHQQTGENKGQTDMLMAFLFGFFDLAAAKFLTQQDLHGIAVAVDDEGHQIEDLIADIIGIHLFLAQIAERLDEQCLAKTEGRLVEDQRQDPFQDRPDKVQIKAEHLPEGTDEFLTGIECVGNQRDTGDDLGSHGSQGGAFYAQRRNRSEAEDQEIIQGHIAHRSQDRDPQGDTGLASRAEHIGNDKGTAGKQQRKPRNIQIQETVADHGRVLHVKRQDSRTEERRGEDPENGIAHDQTETEAGAPFQILLVPGAEELRSENADAADAAIGDHAGKGIDLGSRADRRDFADPGDHECIDH